MAGTADEAVTAVGDGVDEAAHRSTRRDEILRIAARIFAEKGFASATVRDIAEEAGILSGSLYHHFTSKEAMAEELLREYLERMVATYEASARSGLSPRETLSEMIHAAYESVANNTHEVAILHNDWGHLRHVPRFSALDRLGERIEHAWVAAIEAGIAAGAVRAELDAQLVYRTIMGSVLATVRWFDPRRELSIEEIGSQQARIFLDGLLEPSD